MMKRILFILSIMLCWMPTQVNSTVYQGWEKHGIGEQTSPIYLYVKDIDGDGDLDVAATTNVHPKGANSEVAWYRNNMNQDLPWEKFIISSATDSNPIFGANGIVISDIDGDGHEDAVVVTGNVLTYLGDVYWLKAPSDPTGLWQKFEVERGAIDSYFKVYTIDANQDGMQDIVVGGNNGAVLFVNPGTPDQSGAIWEKIPLPEETGSSLYLDDLNGDGRIDIINSHTGMEPDYVGNVSWIDVGFEGGQVVFNRTMIDPALVRAFDVNTIDVGEDQKKDVLVSTFQLSDIYWYEQPAISGDPWTQHVVTNIYAGTDLFTGDMNGDGVTEFVVSGLFANKISWFNYRWEDGEALWTENLIDDNVETPGDISLDDLDADGDLDVIVTSLGSNTVLWYENRLVEPNVGMVNFRAIPGSSKVTLNWLTQYEIDNAGFNIYRSESRKGVYGKINDSLIPGKGSPTHGAYYRFVDRDVQNKKTYYYKLQIYGQRSSYGPRWATPRVIPER